MRLLFSGIGILFYSGLCLYIGARLFVFFRYFLPGMKTFTFWLSFILLCGSFICANLPRLNRLAILRFSSAYWMVVIMYLLLSFALFDILRLALLLCRRSILTPQFTAFGIGALLCLSLLTIIGGAIHARSIGTVNYRVNVDKQGRDMRIALISDLHIGGTVNKARVSRIVDTINRAEPDVVCITGDIFDGSTEKVQDLPAIISEFRRIQAPLGIYACLGNHDVDRMFQGGGTGRIEDILSQAGVVLLQDEAAAVTEYISIAGRRDARPIGMNKTRASAAELCAAIDPRRTVIVLDHQPTQFAEIEKAGADIVLCGHTHRGQLFPANLITRRIYKRAGGVHYGYWKGTTLQAVVTSGAGTWGPPVRIATQNEVAIIDVNFRP
ncbi:MAG: metallophosphoesterase [Treponema sp.]|jgi:predicted MPP superfamily phosphohydrolase|nr:metallophosphoesterase [Treponema sp.]